MCIYVFREDKDNYTSFLYQGTVIGPGFVELGFPGLMISADVISFRVHLS